MPTEAFEVIVSQSGEMNQNVAIANAAKYLAYADQTDTFGYSGDVFDVNMYGGPTQEQDYGIGLCFMAPVPSDDDLKAFMDEMTTLAHVESVERLSVEAMQ